MKWPRIRRRTSAVGGFDFESFRRRQTTFAVLNLFVLAALLLFHTLFSTILGQPSPRLLITLGTAFLLQLLELIWLQTRADLSQSQAIVLNWISILFNLTLALLFTFFTNREESPYFVLLALPVLQAAYDSVLPVLVAVIAVADSMMFFWAWHFATFHPPVNLSEYLEAGVIALIYSLVGVLVWNLVNRIRSDQDELRENMRHLEQTRLKLAQEEKLAAVGRLSSAIAHEIRNPVAMIPSSMATSESAGSTEELRKEMYYIPQADTAAECPGRVAAVPAVLALVVGDRARQAGRAAVGADNTEGSGQLARSVARLRASWPCESLIMISTTWKIKG